MPNSPFLSSQLSGPVAQAVVQGLQNAIQEPLALIQYWANLSISTAQDVDGTLDYVGQLVGFPRPLVTNVFTTQFLLLFADALLPGDVVYSGTGISFAAGDNSVNTTGSSFVTAGFVAGGSIRISGSTGNANDSIATISTVSAAKLVLSGVTVATQAAGPSVTIVQGTPHNGLDDANFSVATSGEFDTAIPAAGNTMPATWYQQLLPIYAEARYGGLSILVVDELAAWANTNGGGTGYRISWNQYDNVSVVFSTFVDPRYLYICNLIVAALETLPLVVFQEP